MTFKQFAIINYSNIKNKNILENKFYYVYRITNTKTKMHYYGSRVCSIQPKQDIGIIYFSSSYNKEFMKDQKINKQDYKYKIVKYCKDNIEKQLFEIYLHNKFDVAYNINFYNKSKQTLVGFDCTGHHYNRGKNLTEETKQKLSNILKGRIVSDETKLKQKNYALQRTKDENLLRGIKHKNKIVSKLTREKQSNKRKGLLNTSAKVTYIFDEKDNLLHICKGSFKAICEENKYPWTTLRKARNGKVLYKDNQGNISKNIPTNSKKYIGWYIKVGDYINK